MRGSGSIYQKTQKRDGASDAPSLFKSRFRYTIIVLFGTFIFLIFLYLADRVLPVFEYGHSKIAEEGIEAGAIFYTGVTKVNDAERFVRSSTTYSPLKVSTSNLRGD